MTASPPAIDGRPWAPWPTEPPTLGTPRLWLRPLRADDLDDLFAVYGDAEVMRHASDPVFASRDLVWHLLASVAALQADGRSIEWGVAERAGGRLVGTCGLHGFDAARREAEVGCLLRRDRWGRGLMREAVQALVDLARDGLGLRALVAEIDPGNVRSLRLFGRLGFGAAGDDRYRLPLR